MPKMSNNLFLKIAAIAHTASQPAASAPPAAVAALAVAGVQLSDWVLMLTGVWISVQIGFFIFDRFFAKKCRRKEDRLPRSDDD